MRYFTIGVYDRRYNMPLDNVRLSVSSREGIPNYRPPDASLIAAARARAYLNKETEARANCTGYAIIETDQHGRKLPNVEPVYYGARFNKAFDVSSVNEGSEP